MGTSKKGFAGLSALRDQVRDATKPVADHADLEAAIERDPAEVAAYLVYADVLQRADDPRGVLIGLQAAQLDRPDDPALADAIERHLAEHALYLLGALAAPLHDRQITVAWFCGFIQRVEVVAPIETPAVLDLLAAIATVPSTRFVRELVLGFGELDHAAVVRRLRELRRPATLEAIDLPAALGEELADAFPRLGDHLAALETVFAAVRRAGCDELVTLTETQARARIARLDHAYLYPEGFVDADADFAGFARGGALACGGGRVSALGVPAGEASVLVDGSLAVDGALELAAGARLLVLGDLACGSLVTSGHLVVLGDLVVSGVFSGGSACQATIVFGAARIGTVLDDEHVLVVHGGHLT